MLENLKNVKSIGLGIICFEGAEHLQNIISELREDLAYVVVAIQDVSYHGDKMNATDIYECKRLKDIGLIDEIIEVKLDVTKEARLQETAKRNLLTEHIEKQGCSHALIIDSDEYYTKKSFERAVKEIDENDYEITYCQYINYYHDYMHYLVYPFGQNGGMYCPFVTKVKYRNSFECHDFPLPSDPTRRYVRPYDRIDKIKDPATGQIYEQKHYTVDYHIFEWSVVKMHHFSWIRENIRKKLNAWSSKKCFDNYEDLIDKAVDRYENFNESNENEYVDLLFNTPNHQCKVAKFPKQYIHPKYDYKTILQHQPSEKQIVILSESCDLNYINQLEDTIRQTWGQKVKNYNNIKLYFVKKSNNGKEYFDGVDTIYVNCNDAMQHTFTKLGLGLRFLHNVLHINYDYLIKTNTSTWLNIEMINKFISYLDNDDIIYGGELIITYWNFFRMFPNGAFIIMNRKTSNLIAQWCDPNNKKQFDEIYQYEEQGGFCDDAMISILTCNRFDKIKVDHTKHFTCLGLSKWLNTNKEFLDNHSEQLYENMAIQIKTQQEDFKDDHELRLTYDKEKMILVNDFWNQKMKNQSEQLYNAMISKLDTQYRLIPIKDVHEYYQKYTIEKRNFNKDYMNFPLVNKKEAIDFMLKMNPKILVHRNEKED